MGESYFTNGSVVMCKYILDIITCTLTFFPFPYADVMWFWAINGYAHLDAFYGILLNFGCIFSQREKTYIEVITTRVS